MVGHTQDWIGDTDPSMTDRPSKERAMSNLMGGSLEEGWQELGLDRSLQGLKEWARIWHHPLEVLPLVLQGFHHPSISRLGEAESFSCQLINAVLPMLDLWSDPIRQGVPVAQNHYRPQPRASSRTFL